MELKTTLTVKLDSGSYPIYVGRGLLSEIGEIINLKRRVLIVTDSGVPHRYASTVLAACDNARIFTFPMGEENKNIRTYENIIAEMLDFGMQRCDAVIALGGGVVGDLAGFAAATYMRGIDFYNIPSTLLSQVDSSVGGKTGFDFRSVKNIVGAFYQPKAVIIDTDTLQTLDKRQFSAGCAEIIKMALCFDKELFDLTCHGIDERNLTDAIIGSLMIKQRVVELDEREGGLRRALNFGHTIGHGIEALGGRLHGECVALGMLPMVADGIRDALILALSVNNLPTDASINTDLAISFMKNDKKGEGDFTYAVFVDEIGSHRIEKVHFSILEGAIKKYF